VASHEGVHAVEHLAGQDPGPLDYGRVPSCTYTTPQVASFGLSEEKLREKGVEYKKGVANLKASGKAMTLGENSGFVKILSDPATVRILGAHIVAPEAAELLHELLIAAAGNVPVGLVGRTMHAHPTLAESIMEAALAVEGKAIHL
jgi:dihydrolipoamide dehydrogenase